jgi:N-acetyl-alpha-D-muramate 1-phosphate uridylyltransferase
MKAMLFAAGRGQRMRPLTNTLPKPLLRVGGKSLIQWHIERLREAGVEEFVVNTAHLGQQLVDTLGDGSQLKVQIQYSREELSSAGGALETAGAIRYALPLLGEEPFIAVSSDIYSEFEYSTLNKIASHLSPGHAYCVLVSNPSHHGDGDFFLNPSTGEVRDKTSPSASGGPSHTFSGIAVFHPSMFAHLPNPVSNKLAPILRQNMDETTYPTSRVKGEIFTGSWIDVGTPERLTELDKHLTQAPRPRR